MLIRGPFILSLALLLASCGTVKRLFAKRNYLWPKYVPQADFQEEKIIPGTYEVLKVTLLKYDPWSSHHNRHYTVLRLKNRSLKALPIGMAIPVSDSLIRVSGYTYGGDHFLAYFEEITGTIKREASRRTEFRIRFDLRYKHYNADGRFRKTVLFYQDSAFFKANQRTPGR